MLGMDTKDLSDNELLQYFEEHVRYEFQELLKTALVISKELPLMGELVLIKHSPVEAYAIHLRNIINFFYPKTIRASDVCARHFFKNEKDWDNVRPEITDVIERARQRADKEVGHLTTARQFGTPESKYWPVATYTMAVVPLLETFATSADKISLRNSASFVQKDYDRVRTQLKDS